ncbi:endopeptidase La [Mycoplasmopsis primatum]|uniref:endopeptidase La n=1 Tax=Mycoplasmopsis primatum TaxID=55604 RepID=UPI0004983F81
MLFDYENAKLILTPELIAQNEFLKKAIKDYTKNNGTGIEKVKKEQFLLMWYLPSDDNGVIFKSELESKKDATYKDVLENITISNVNQSTALCQIDSIETIFDPKTGDPVYIADIKALHKYDLVNVFGGKEVKVGKHSANEEPTLINIEYVECERYVPVDDKIAIGDPTIDINGFEEAMNTLIKNRVWGDALVLYRHIRGSSFDDIQKWSEYAMSNHSSIVGNLDNPMDSLINALCNFFTVPPYERNKIFEANSLVEKFASLRWILALMVDVIKKFVETHKKEFANDADYMINQLTESALYKQVKEDNEESLFVELNSTYDDLVNELCKMYDEYRKLNYVSEKDLSTIILSIKSSKNNSPVNKKRADENIKDQLDRELNRKIQNNLDKQQKEFLLREKMKAIKEQLNESDAPEDEEDEFTKSINDPVLRQIYPEFVIKAIKAEKEKLKGMMSSSPDSNIIQTYINNIKKLPWRKVEIENLDIKHAREVLDKNHYGLKEVKERVIEYLSLIINHKNNNKEAAEKDLINIDERHQIDLQLFKETKNNRVQKQFNNVPILTLVGPPGTGKTSLARSIAEALDKSYVKISLGGVHDESEIRGHRKTYVGAMPGKIIKGIQSAGVSNPLILLDEIDKMSSDIKGDPTSAMLEVLDPEQNTKFQDNYVEHEYDLSKVLFIATANYYENIPAPLLDRVEIIELNSYTISEKVKIAREHLINIVIEQAGLTKDQFQIDDKSIEFIIKHYTAEAGVRSLKRNLDKIARKIVTKIVAGEKIQNFVINEKNILDLLGTPKISDSENDKTPQIGSVNGLAFTSIGGTTLQIEVSLFKSKQPGIRLTGQLKEVMQESAKIALSYVRANAEKFGIKNIDFDNTEIHVHVPEGAVPKDGPSAGVTFTTALISALTKIPVSQKVAMTGEITLRGKVLEIGGLKEKSFAAYKKNIETVFIPKSNEKNLADIPDEVKENVKFIPVSHYDEIWDKLFAKQVKTNSTNDKLTKTTKKQSK